MAKTNKRWLDDPVAFFDEIIVNHETGKSFVLYDEQKRFLREALRLTPDGRLAYSECVFSAPKKSGKSTTAALAMLYVIIVLGGPFAEGLVIANALDQASERVFLTLCRIIEASPRLKGSATITTNKVTFKSTGATITAIPSRPTRPQQQAATPLTS